MIVLPERHQDVVASIVLYKTPRSEVEHAVHLFQRVPLKTHMCVIDNSPTPLDYPLPAGVSYHFAGKNLGYGRAHNIAIGAARGRARYSLVMNTDVDYKPEVVTRLVAFLDGRSTAGLAAPQIRYPDGRLQYVCRLLPTPKNFLLRRFLPTSRWAKIADEDYELRWWKHDTIANLPYFQGSFIMFRTDLLNDVGGFDERFFMYGEDIDLTRRMHKISETLYVPDVHVTHQYRRLSSRGLRGTWIGLQNNCRYLQKWGWFFDDERERINAATRRRLLANQR
jgi:GT2 family glycosyltransferase